MPITIEEITAFFETDDGKSVLDGFKKPLIDKNAELINELRTTKSDLTSLKTADEDRERIATQKASDDESTRLEKENDFDAYKLFHEGEVGKLNKQVTDLKSKTADTEVSRLITEIAGKNSNSPKPLQLLLRERVSGSINDEGVTVVTVKGEDGKPMYHDGQPATVGHLVESLRSNEEYGSFFSASGASGSGTNSSDETPNTGDYKDMNSDKFNLTKASGNKV